MPFCEKCGAFNEKTKGLCAQCGAKIVTLQSLGTAYAETGREASAERPRLRPAGPMEETEPECGTEPARNLISTYAEKDETVSVRKTAAQPGHAAGRQPPGTDHYSRYITTLTARLNMQPEYSTSLNAYTIRAEKFKAFVTAVPSMTKYHYYIFIQKNDSVGPDNFFAFRDACFRERWNMPHHLGLSSNDIVIPVYCQDAVRPETETAMEKPTQSKHTFASGMLCYPVMLELSTGRMIYPKNTPFYGWAVWSDLKRVVSETLYYYP